MTFIPSPIGPVVLEPEKAKTPTVTHADVFDRAAEIIEKRGWARHAWVRHSGEVCILGAIGLAASELRHESVPSRLRDSRSSTEDFAPTAAMYFMTSLGLSQSAFYRWNDHLLWRPAAQVKKRFRRLADATRGFPS